jgi:hypothetical protein
MAKSDNLPIYNSAFSLLKNLHERVPKFSKLYKYGLGEKVLVCGMDIVLLIVEANNQKSNYTRISSIEKIIKKTDELMLYIRLAEELKQFNSAKAYPFLVDKICEISRQSAGWKNTYLPQNYRQAMPVSVGKEMPPLTPQV